MPRVIQFSPLLFAFILIWSLLLAPSAAAGEVEDRLAAQLTESVPGLRVNKVSPAGDSGLYEVQANNGELLYATPDGNYLLAGELLKLTGEGIVNITEESRAAARLALMTDFGKEGVISFPASSEQKAEIAVFTDIDCPYCRKFHEDVKRLNELGITVNYYGFPRSGPDTPSYHKYVSVWCSEDPQAAMTRAKQGGQIPEASCENPVAEQFRLGLRVGVEGTPAIVLEDGTMVRGYVPADNLAKGLGLL